MVDTLSRWTSALGGSYVQNLWTSGQRETLDMKNALMMLNKTIAVGRAG